MKSMDKRLRYVLACAAILFSLNTLNFAHKKKLNLKARFGLAKLAQKKDRIPSQRSTFEQKYGDVSNLARRFATIRDLGSIVRCRLRSEETTVVTGNSLICGGKRYSITPEAAKDAEESATSRQTVPFAESSGPQDIVSTMKAGLYGRPIMSFLGASQNLNSKADLLEPHEKYPYMGIFDKGLRTADPAMFTSSRPASVSLDHGSNLNSFDDISDTQVRNFGGMELGDISHAVNDDETKLENQDSFYRNSQLQNDAFETSGQRHATNNPFGQYWKSLKTGFYETTASQLNTADPASNSLKDLNTQIRRARISRRRDAGPSIKKSEIQLNHRQPKQQQNAGTSESRKTIPKPKAVNAKSSSLAPGHKRYFISGQRQFPLGMFAGVPVGPWQMNRMQPEPLMGAFNRYSMMPQARLLQTRGWNRDAPQQGVTRSFRVADEWGTRASPRYFDPYLTGSPVRAPMNPLYVQMRANEFTGEPGQPTRGKFQYGIQPGNGPPFLGYASVPIMQPVPMSDADANQPQFDGDGSMERGFEGGQNAAEGFARGSVPFNYEANNEPAPNNGNNVPGLVRGTEQEVFDPTMQRGFLPGNPDEGMSQMPEGGFGSGSLDESGPSAMRSMEPQEDASDDFQRISDPEKYVPAPFYRPPSYNPHETEDFFPDGTNEKFHQEEDAYLQQNGYSPHSVPYREQVKSREGNAAEIYEDEKRQEEQREEEEEQRKRANLRSTTRIDINGNKIEEGSDGKFVLTKEHVGFGPITVEAKTAKSAMKDPGDDDK